MAKEQKRVVARKSRPEDRRRQEDYWRQILQEQAKILVWLREQPDATAKSLFQRLQSKYPGRFPGGQLRTLLRRIRDWRRVMARELIFNASNWFEATEALAREKEA